MPNCSSRKRWLQRRVKKNLFADLLATDVVQEIETLLGRQAVEDLDLEALELAVRQQVLQLAGAPSSNVSMPTPAMSKAPELVVDVGSQRDLPGAGPNRCRVSSVPYDWSAPTITAPPAATATVLAISTWA